MSSPVPDVLATIAESPAPHASRAPHVVPFDAPWGWLALGWNDLWSQPVLSLGYGGIFTALAVAMTAGLWEPGLQGWLPPLAGAFLLVAPLFAVGLYESSRLLASGQRPTLRQVLTAGFDAPGQLALFGLFLMLVCLAWLEIAFLLLMLFLGTGAVPPPEHLVPTLLLTPHGLTLLVVGSLVGGLIAAIVFVVSVVGVPMLMVEPVDAVSAARASVRAVIANPKAMALWAGLIAMMMAAGFATLFVGLVLAFPLIGHATWHAYMQIYGRPAHGAAAQPQGRADKS